VRRRPRCAARWDQQLDVLQVEAKYGGLEVSDAKRLKALEDENAKLKKLLAEAMLDNAMLKDVASKKLSRHPAFADQPSFVARLFPSVAAWF
jgi:hypothetical protein